MNFNINHSCNMSCDSSWSHSASFCEAMGEDEDFLEQMMEPTYFENCNSIGRQKTSLSPEHIAPQIWPIVTMEGPEKSLDPTESRDNDAFPYQEPLPFVAARRRSSGLSLLPYAAELAQFLCESGSESDFNDDSSEDSSSPTLSKPPFSTPSPPPPSYSMPSPPVPSSAPVDCQIDPKLLSKPLAHAPRLTSPHHTQWKNRYSELLHFKQKFGHCNVPYSNKGLGQWVKRQRYQYKMRLAGRDSTLTDERFELLENVEFIWDSHGASWEERFRDLLSFKAEHGHCYVPARHANSKLASWAKSQRHQYKISQKGKQSTLNPVRLQMLNEVGFIWDPRQFLESSDNVSM